MKIELISYSQPDVYFVENMTELVAFCARVSNPSNQNNKDTSEKLIRYLVKNQHWSPLEMVSMCLEIETTRDIARQILRHRSFSFQEFSQRYADPTEELDFVLREARLQDTKNRQNSIELDKENVWNSLDTYLNKNIGNFKTSKVQAREVISFSQDSIHRATPTINGGWRFFGRVSHTYRKPQNELRKQVQVFVDRNGW